MDGKKWAYGSFALGILTSVGGNVGHTMLKPHAAFGSILFSIFWPVAVFLSIETMASVNWPEATVWRVARFGGLSLVALVAALASYNHISALLATYGESGIVAMLGPLSPDGLMIVATVALLATRRSEIDVEALEDEAEGDDMAEAAEGSSEPASGNELNGHRPRQLAKRRRRPKATLTREQIHARNEEARQLYRASVTDGTPLSYQELATRFAPLGERWARDRIKEARQELANLKHSPGTLVVLG